MLHMVTCINSTYTVMSLITITLMNAVYMYGYVITICSNFYIRVVYLHSSQLYNASMIISILYRLASLINGHNLGVFIKYNNVQKKKIVLS